MITVKLKLSLICPVLCCLLCLCMISGCVDDIIKPQYPVASGSVVFEVLIPGYEVPKTRSIEGNKGEAAVKVMDILIFDNSAPAKLLEHIKTQKITPVTSGDEYKVTFAIKPTPTTNAKSIVLIANASAQVDAAMTTHLPGAEKQDILADLKFATPNSGGSYAWNVSDNYTPIPMYGEVAVNGISYTTTVPPISLIRMVARIDIQNKVSATTFNLQNIYLVNYNTVGYIAPKWDTQNGEIAPTDQHSPLSMTNPMIPTPSGKQPGTKDASIKYEYQQGTESGTLKQGEIYTYEAVKSSEDGDTGATCLILEGEYQGTVYFYRVDFVVPENDESGPQYIPIYRNHKYIFTITEASGRGYTSFEEALKSTTVVSNLKTTLIVIPMNGINDIIYNGQYFVGVENSEIELVWGVEREWVLPVSSNYTGKWTAEILNPAQDTWLRFPGNLTVISGDDITTTGLGLKAAAVASVRNGNDYYKGEIALTAGRLRMNLTVARVPIASLFARSNVIESGGTLTFAVTETDNQTIPAWSQGVFFKWGSLVSVSPAGNPYNPTVHILHNPTSGNPSGWGTGLAGWDNIPYAHSKFGFPPTSSTGNNHYDAFANYNTKGYNETAGVGDVCRYISNYNHASGRWVEGHWRMPTYAEIEMLYAESGITTAHWGTFADNTQELNTNHTTYRYGNYNPVSGRWYGAGVNSSLNTSQTGVPPPETVFLPISGQRYPDGGGNVVHTGAYGYYWTATPYDNVTVNHPFLSSDGLTDYDADKSYAFPVRCIRDY